MISANRFLSGSRAERAAIILICAQIIIKIFVEIRTSFDARMAVVPIISIMLAVAWVAIIVACLYGKRTGYLWGGLFGILHIVLALPLPFSGICDHYFMAIFVSAHGLLISVSSFRAYRAFPKHVSASEVCNESALSA